MKKFWVLYFLLVPIGALWLCWVAPTYGWWFPGSMGPTHGEAASPLGRRIDDLFYMILVITTITFIGTQLALCWVLWTGSSDRDADGAPRKAWYSHGSHNLEVIWSIVPAGVLLFIALYQMDVWANYRVRSQFPEEVQESGPMAEVTARQFEWRIRYPGLDANGKPLPLLPDPQPTDLYTVNDLHVPAGVPVLINLRTQDVQHSFFLPELRVKQDAVPGLVIPVWFEAERSGTFEMLCAELCGWGHYKMKARLVAQKEDEFVQFLEELRDRQNYDGVKPGEEEPAE